MNLDKVTLAADVGIPPVRLSASCVLKPKQRLGKEHRDTLAALVTGRPVAVQQRPSRRREVAGHP